MKQYTDYEIIKAAHEWIDKYKIPLRGPGIFEYVEILTGWTIWTGGECPVPSGLRVEVMFHDGEVATVKDSQSLYWGREEKPNEIDIIAYRIIEPDISELRGLVFVGPKRAPFWAKEKGLYHNEGYDSLYFTWREVKERGWRVRKLTPEDISDGDQTK